MTPYLRAYYSAIAPLYDLVVRIGSFGAFPRLHRAAAVALRLHPGDTVMDIGCGTGLLFPHLVERVGARGRVIGVDSSERMLAVARRRVEKHRWTTVDLRLADAATLVAEPAVDGVVFSISLSAFRDCENVLAWAIGLLKPGRHLVIVDAFLNSGRWFYAATNLYTRLKAPVVGSKLDNRLRETARAMLDQVEIDVRHAGLYSIISGRAPGETSTARERESLCLRLPA